MSLLLPDQSQSYMNSNFDMFIGETSAQLERAHESPVMETPPPVKRRRGRPAKCPQIPDGQPSPAANSSAAVVKQGTPKASAPLMRVSPLKGTKKRIGSSPLKHKGLISPRGGTLLSLDGGKSDARSTKAKSSRVKKNSFYTLLPSKTSAAPQRSIHSITSEAMPDKLSSVNPTFLLSSPMSASKIKEINKSRVPHDLQKQSDLSQRKMDPPTSIPLNSSPMTPNSASSSCFSTIMRSSPLYHGYYANQFSPNTSVLASSPMRLQMKPLSDISVDKEETKCSGESSTKEASSPLEKQAKEDLKLEHPEDEGPYKLSFSVDEYGQAQVTKVKIELPQLKPSASPGVKLDAPYKLTRHQSLANISHPLHSLGRSASLSSVPTLRSSKADMFIEPFKVSNDASFFNSISDELGFEVMTTPPHQEGFNFAEELSTTSEDPADDDDSVDFDARSALMKLVRRSL